MVLQFFGCFFILQNFFDTVKAPRLCNSVGNISSRNRQPTVASVFLPFHLSEFPNKGFLWIPKNKPTHTRQRLRRSAGKNIKFLFRYYVLGFERTVGLKWLDYRYSADSDSAHKRGNFRSISTPEKTHRRGKMLP